MFSVPSGRSEYLDTQLGETPILYIHISFSRLAVKIPSKLIQAQVGFFFTLPDLSFMFKAERSGVGTLSRASCCNLMYIRVSTIWEILDYQKAVQTT